MNQQDFPLLRSLPRALVDLSRKLAAARKAGDLVVQAGDQGFASAPSNIALLKYWGKHRNLRQVPVSSSVSRSLDGFRSFTRVVALTRMRELPLDTRSYPRPPHEFRMQTENVSSSLAAAAASSVESSWAVGEKLRDFLDSLLNGWADDIALSIESRNNFPTGCGVASSASGYAALVGAIADMAGLRKHFTASELQMWLTEWARIGSGSATRSAVLTERSPSFVTWEVSAAPGVPAASADAAIESQYLTHTREIHAHTSIRALNHLLVVVSAEHKKISSSEGHLSAENSRFQSIRVAGLAERFESVLSAIEDGQVDTLRFLSEEDALSMHAVMATSTPPITYMTDLTTAIIAKFLGERRRCGWQALWTLDAGPNVHLLVAPESEAQVRSFLDKEFGQLIVEILSGDAKLPVQSDLTGLVMGADRLSGVFNG
jgi:diphosphomevalonate decarboxylase